MLAILIQVFIFITPAGTDPYKEKIGWIESRGNYCATNGDHFGKYQFSMVTICDLIRIGLLAEPEGGLTVEYFLTHPAYQEKTMNAHIYHQTQLMGPFLKYRGRRIGGVRITIERLYAGMHFIGPKGLRHFLRTGSLLPHGKYVKVDRNGTSVIRYMQWI